MALSDMYAGGNNQSPFSNALSNFMQARQTAQTQRLMAPAMSGDLSALNQLMSVNPQAGMQVQQTMAQQQQQRAQQEQQAIENERASQEFGMQQEQWGLNKQLLERKLNEQAAGPSPIKLGKGERLVDPNTFKVLAGSEVDPVEGAQQATNLRKELADLSKSFQVQDDAYGRVLASAKDPSPAGDMALIFNYMKVLDPGSSVREGEYASAANAGSVPARIQALYNKAVDGKQLEASQRKDFVTRARMLYTDAADKQVGKQKRYTELASKANLDPTDVVENMVNFRDPDYQSVIGGGKPAALAPQQPVKFLGFE
jgi:hypothetical protein